MGRTNSKYFTNKAEEFTNRFKRELIDLLDDCFDFGYRIAKDIYCESWQLEKSEITYEPTNELKKQIEELCEKELEERKKEKTASGSGN